MRGAAPLGPVEVRRGFPEGQRAAAVAIYWAAFRDKLGRVMGPEPAALAYLAAVMRPDHCFAAFDSQGRLLGLAGFKTVEGSFAGGTGREMQRIYGRLGAFWRGFLLHRLASDVDNENFLIDGIAVAEEARGQGVGTALLAALYAEAEARRYPALRLEVVEENRRAQALYARHGYVTVTSSRIGLLRYAFRFRAAHTMIRPIA